MPGFAGYIKTPTRADAVRTILPEDPHWGTEKQKSGTLHRLTSLCTADASNHLKYMKCETLRTGTESVYWKIYTFYAPGTLKYHLYIIKSPNYVHRSRNK